MFATFVTAEAANAAGLTTTVSVIGFGLVAPAPMTVLLVQVAVLLPTTVVEQFQPVPVGIEATVKPVGKLSVTVMVPLVSSVPGLLAVNVYVPLTPTVKLPLCDFAIVRSGSWLIVVASLAESLAVLVSPPPETLTVFVTLAGALLATVTLSVIAG